MEAKGPYLLYPYKMPFKCYGHRYMREKSQLFGRTLSMMFSVLLCIIIELYETCKKTLFIYFIENRKHLMITVLNYSWHYRL